MSEEEAQLRVVWVGSVVIGVELAIGVLVAFFLAVQLFLDVDEQFDDIFSQETFNIVSTGCATPPFFSDAVLAFVKGWTPGQQNAEIADGKTCLSKMGEMGTILFIQAKLATLVHRGNSWQRS